MASAVVLTSSGLDSLLTIKLMQQTKINIKVVHFDIGLTYDKPILAGQRISKYHGLEYLVKNSIEITKFDIAKEFYSEVFAKKGYSNVNACLEYQIFLLKKAREYMKEIKADFIVTGDVLNQRPNIQSKKSLLFSDIEAEVEGLVFRPLSAALLPETIAQTKFQLPAVYDFEGFDERREKLAQQLGICEYPKEYHAENNEIDMGRKAFEIFEKGFKLNTAHLNRLGAHLNFEEKARLIIGRTPFESKYLQLFYKKMLPVNGTAFAVKEPRYHFGFLYGENISPTHVNKAPGIFTGMIEPLDQPKIIYFYDKDYSFFGSKKIEPIPFAEYSEYIHKELSNEFSCPLFTQFPRYD